MHGLFLFVYVSLLEVASPCLKEKLMAPQKPGTYIRRGNREEKVLREIIRLRQEALELFTYTVVKMETAANSNTNSKVKDVMSSPNSYRGTFRTAETYQCSYRDDVYKNLLPFKHRTHLLYHVSLIGVTSAFHVKSSTTEILYSVLVENPKCALKNYRPGQIQLFELPVLFLYSKHHLIRIPSFHPGAYLHSQEGQRFCYIICVWRFIHKHIREKEQFVNGAEIVPGPHAL